jgi:hypothetical protein
MYFSKDCLLLGLNLLRYSDREIDRVCDRTNRDRFSEHYGFPPETVAAVLNNNSNINRNDLFMTFSRWKLYDSEHAMESRWKKHPETI